jgi:RHS repeat-associated protein
VSQTGGGFVQRSQALTPDLFGLGRQVLRGWKALDVDGDGRTDLVYVHCAGMSATATCLVEVEVLFADGNGTWNQAFPQRFTWPGAKADVTLVPGDVDGDGRTDLIFLMNEPGAGPGSGVRVQVLTATGTAATPFTPGNVNAFSLGSPQGPFPGMGEDVGLWRPADVDGDGRMDLVHISSAGSYLMVRTLRARPDGQFTPVVSLPIWQGAAELWSDVSPLDTLHWHVADINGDGMTDLVHIASVPTAVMAPDAVRCERDTRFATDRIRNINDILDRRSPDIRPPSKCNLRVHTLLSDGTGVNWTQSAQDLPFSSADLALLASRTGWMPTDANRDGHVDFVHVEWTPAGVRVDTLLSNGNGLFTSSVTTIADPSSNGNRLSPTWQVTDLDGDGRGDVSRIDLTAPAAGAGRQLQVSDLASVRSNELLTSITNSLGGTTTITYADGGSQGPSQPSFGCFVPAGTTLQLVASATINDGRGTSETTRFGYACPRWSSRHRAFLGWTDVFAGVAASANRAAVRLLQRYAHTDTCQTQILDRAFLDEAGTYVGSRDMIGYEPPALQAPHRCVMLYRNRVEHGMSASTLNVYTSFTFDEVGNPRSIVDYGAVAAAGDEVTTTINYQYAYDPWIVGLPWQQTTTDPARPGSVLRSTFYCYDGSNGTDSSNCPGVPTKGLLTAVQRLDDLGLYVTNTYQYDAFGNLAAQQDPLRFGKAAFFDNTYHVFPESVVNVLGQSISSKWDMKLGKIWEVTDPNGAVTSARHDVFGRVEQVTATNYATTHRRYLDWGDPTQQRIHEYIEDGTADGLWTDTYLDGLGRVYKVVRKGSTAQNASMRQLTYTDASPRLHTLSVWALEGTGTPPVDTFEYDGPGRLVKITHADNATERIVYDASPSGTVRRVTNERGLTKTIAFDAFNRLASVTQMDRATGQTATTRYAYNLMGELVGITDPNGNVTRKTWDMLGQLRQVQSPDLGVRTYTYDLAGRLKTQTEGCDRTITYTYDNLGRMKTKAYENGQTITWNYDEPGAGASVGRLTSLSDLTSTMCPQGRSDKFTYDLHGALLSHVKCIDGMTYTTGLSYDRLRRLDAVTYPNSERVTYGYDNAGRVASMTGYVDLVEYNPTGQPTQINYANGTEATFTYYPDRPWLKTVRLSGSGNTTLFDTTYTYEPNGVVKSTSSTTNSMNVTFGYDDLDRLLTATGDINESFAYDAAGNITRSTAAGGYTYPAPGPQGCLVNGVRQGCPRPNAPESLYGGIYTSAGVVTLYHNANGNLSMMRNAQNQLKSIDWTDDQKPFVVSDFDGTLSTCAYDAGGVRVSQQRRGAYFRYFNPLVEHSTVTGLTKSYYIGSLLVARRTPAAARWFHGDQIGSIRLETDGTGAAFQRYDYTPYGAATGGGAVTGPGGAVRFAAAQNDENGLIYMGARYYDPILARFISPDTIVGDIGNTQAVNPYAYTYNSPQSYTDPSGHQALGIGQQYQFELGAFSISLTVDRAPVPPPIATPARALGQICSACSGGSSVESSPVDWINVPGGYGVTTAPTVFDDRGVSFPINPEHFAGALIYGDMPIESAEFLSLQEWVQRGPTWTLSNWRFFRSGTVEASVSPLDFYNFGFRGASNLLSREIAAANSGSKLRTVTSWADEGITPDLKPGRWVQLGEATKTNFWKTGLPGPKAYLEPKPPFLRLESSKVPFTNSITSEVPASSLKWPSGWEKWKGILGQRQITGGGQ